MKKFIPVGLLAVTPVLLAGCASFRGVSAVEPPPSWVVQVSTDYLPSIMRFSAEIQCGGDVEIMRSLVAKTSGDFVNLSDVEGQSALVKLTPSDALKVYRNAVRLLQRFRFRPETTPLSAHSITVRLLVGNTALEVYLRGFTSPEEYPPEFRNIVRIVQDQNPKYISDKEIGANITLQVQPEGVPSD